MPRLPPSEPEAQHSAPTLRGWIIDAAVAVLLLLLVCLLFYEAVADPDTIPAGTDLLQHYSRESAIRRAFAAGTFPLWNPYEFSGFPLQADPQTGVFYPPSVLLRLLPLPSFLTWTVVFHVWLFGAGGYVLCRYLQLSRPVALVAGIALMFGGITMPRVYAGHLDVLRTVAWIPLTLALAFRSLDRESFRPLTALVVVLCCQLLGSFVQLVAYTFSAIALYALFSMIWPRSTRRSWRQAGAVAGQLGVLVALVAGATAFQLLPTARLVLAAGRTGGMPYEDAAQPNFGLAEFVTFLTPPIGTDDVPSESWETSAYVGILLACLAPLALFASRRRRMTLFLALLAGVTLAFASGGALYRLHYDLVPMFRIPGRFLVFWSIGVCALGAIALGWVTDDLATGPRRRIPRALQIAILIVAGVGVTVDVGAYARRFVQPRTFEDRFVQISPVIASPGGRVLSLCENRLTALELSALAIPTVDGYNSYFLADYARFALLARGMPPPQYIPAYPRIGAEFSLPDLDRVSLLNVTEIVSCAPLDDERLRLLYEQAPFYIYRNTQASGRVMTAMLGDRPCDDSALSTINAKPGTISSIITDRPDGTLRFVVSSAARHLLVLSEPYYPERRAFVDGVETMIQKMHGALSAICVGPGVHIVEVRYVPTSLWLGAALSVMTVLLFAIIK